MTECQGCGAWNDASRTVCVLCGTPLAATDEWDAAAELPPLPPLPDGGLRTSMPSWLRDPLPAPAPITPSPHHPITPVTTLGATADPRTFLCDDDFPQWLRDLAARQDVSTRRAGDRRVPPPRSPVGDGHPAPDGWPDWPGPAADFAAARDAIPATGRPASGIVAAAATDDVPAAGDALGQPSPTTDVRPPAAVVAARAREERRNREPWESLLLVLLVLGVLVAALWALVANGVFSPGL